MFLCTREAEMIILCLHFSRTSWTFYIIRQKFLSQKIVTSEKLEMKLLQLGSKLEINASLVNTWNAEMKLDSCGTSISVCHKVLNEPNHTKTCLKVIRLQGCPQEPTAAVFSAGYKGLMGRQRAKRGRARPGRIRTTKGIRQVVVWLGSVFTVVLCAIAYHETETHFHPFSMYCYSSSLFLNSLHLTINPA